METDHLVLELASEGLVWWGSPEVPLLIQRGPPTPGQPHLEAPGSLFMSLRVFGRQAENTEKNCQ